MLVNRPAPLPSPSLSKQKGVTLMESLVALVVLAFGVMGLLGLQLRTMTNNQNANHMATAARLADNLFEAINTNPNASQASNTTYNINAPTSPVQWGWLANYANAWGNLPAVGTNCDTTFCTAAQKATWDVNRWKQSIRQSLPNGEAVVQLGSIPRQVVVIVGWRANEQAGTDNPTAFNLPAPVQVPAACGTTHTCYFAYGQP
jgi:type IV pilus assembly protein PilV